MMRRLMILVMVVLFVSGCSAFDSDNTPYEGFNERDIPFNPFLAVGPYEGVYKGSMTLEEADEACASVSEAVGEAKEMVVDVIQAGDLISVQFEDGMEENGKLYNDKVTIVRRGVSDVRMFNLEFMGEGVVQGKVEVFEGESVVDPCALYSITLAKDS